MRDSRSLGGIRKRRRGSGVVEKRNRRMCGAASLMTQLLDSRRTIEACLAGNVVCGRD